MDYIIESTNIDVSLYNHKYLLLCEKKSTPEVEVKKTSFLKKIIMKIKNLVIQMRNWIVNKRIDHLNKKLNKMQGTVNMQIPENETPKSFSAKIDLFIKRMKSKSLTEDQANDMKNKLTKGVIIAVPTTIAALIVRNLLQAIPVSDALAKEYDRKITKQDIKDARVSHKGIDKDTTVLTLIPSVIGSIKNKLGKIANAVEKPVHDIKYDDMNYTERRKANMEIKKTAKQKAAKEKDIMKKLKDNMKVLDTNDPYDKKLYDGYEKMYNDHKVEYQKYSRIHTNSK